MPMLSVSSWVRSVCGPLSSGCMTWWCYSMKFQPRRRLRPSAPMLCMNTIVTSLLYIAPIVLNSILFRGKFQRRRWGFIIWLWLQVLIELGRLLQPMYILPFVLSITFAFFFSFILYIYIFKKNILVFKFICFLLPFLLVIVRFVHWIIHSL